MIYLDPNDVDDYVTYKFFLASDFEWMGPKSLKLNKYTCISSKRCLLEVDLECHKELR